MIEATRIAKAADACAQAGSIDEAVTVSMELEQILYKRDVCRMRRPC
jgi:hypothetical protein